MKTFGSRSGMGVALSFIPILALVGSARGQVAEYLDHAGLTRELRTLVNSTDLAAMKSVGTTLEGREVWMVEVGDPGGAPLDQRREVWMVEVGDPGGAPLDQRPGVLIVGNLEGDHLVGSHLVPVRKRGYRSTVDPEVRWGQGLSDSNISWVLAEGTRDRIGAS